MQEFTSFAAFGRHLGRLALQGDAVTERITERTAAIIQDEAQAKIGVYQEASGGFPAWAPLADSTVADRIRQGFSPLEPLLRTGTLRDSYSSTTSGGEAVIGSTSDIALWQEQGTEHIPPRPVLGPAAFESKAKIGALGASIMVAWLIGAPWRRLQGSKLPTIDSAIAPPT